MEIFSKHLVIENDRYVSCNIVINPKYWCWCRFAIGLLTQVKKYNPGGYYLTGDNVEEPVTSGKSRTWSSSKSRSKVLLLYVLNCFHKCKLIKRARQTQITTKCTKGKYFFYQKINFRWLLVNSFDLSDSRGFMNIR